MITCTDLTVLSGFAGQVAVVGVICQGTEDFIESTRSTFELRLWLQQYPQREKAEAVH